MPQLRRPYHHGDTPPHHTGYRMFRCRTCRRTCNERTGTPYNHLQVPTDIAVLVVLWRFYGCAFLCTILDAYAVCGAHMRY